MELVKTYIEDLFILKSNVFNDRRGEFIKTFNEEFLKKII
jgi:dTDP-4-dehydrorhamnose 3,5-epimerase-like enzyme